VGFTYSSTKRAWRINHGLERRLLRDAQNPFELPHDNFLTYFRISQDLAMDMTNILRPYFQRECISGLPPEIKILVAFNFWANGSYQTLVGN